LALHSTCGRKIRVSGRLLAGHFVIPSRAHALEIDEADVRAYCTGEKPVARVVILALEGRICAEWRPRENETEPALGAAGRRQPDLRIRLGCITQSRRKVRRPPAYRSSPGRE
jgi:hypothetical protein